MKNVPPLGFILGDEGSSAYMGKRLIADVLKGIAPADIKTQFLAAFNVNQNILMDEVYTNSLPSRSLARFAPFLADNLSNPYVYKLVYDGFMSFFNRNIKAYDYKNNPLCFVGSTAVSFQSVLERAAEDFGAKIAKIIPNSMPGLVEYHSES